MIGGNTEFVLFFLFDEFLFLTCSPSLMEQFGPLLFCLFFDCLWEPSVGTRVYWEGPKCFTDLLATQSSKERQLRAEEATQSSRYMIRRLELSSSAGNGLGNTELVLHSRTPEPGGGHHLVR